MRTTMETITLLQGEQPSWISDYGGGYGYGYDYGYGYGDGSGDGYGGYGYGGGDGYGYGSGYGYGDGYGYGSKEYWLATIDDFASKWPDIFRQRLASLRNSGATIAFWRSSRTGLPSNGGGGIEAAAPGVVHIAWGPIALCKRGTLHATLLPTKWKGERWWIVALIGEVVGDEEKYGALTREILGEAI
jgi:hypothetical protein